MTSLTHKQDGSFYTMLMVNGDQVVLSRWHSTEAGARRWAAKMIAAHG